LGGQRENSGRVVNWGGTDHSEDFGENTGRFRPKPHSGTGLGPWARGPRFPGEDFGKEKNPKHPRGRGKEETATIFFPEGGLRGGHPFSGGAKTGGGGGENEFRTGPQKSLAGAGISAPRFELDERGGAGFGPARSQTQKNQGLGRPCPRKDFVILGGWGIGAGFNPRRTLAFGSKTQPGGAGRGGHAHRNGHRAELLFGWGRGGGTKKKGAIWGPGRGTPPGGRKGVLVLRWNRGQAIFFFYRFLRGAFFRGGRGHLGRGSHPRGPGPAAHSTFGLCKNPTGVFRFFLGLF